jgi:hypothetical protein
VHYRVIAPGALAIASLLLAVPAFAATYAPGAAMPHDTERDEAPTSRPFPAPPHAVQASRSAARTASSDSSGSDASPDVAARSSTGSSLRWSVHLLAHSHTWRWLEQGLGLRLAMPEERSRLGCPDHRFGCGQSGLSHEAVCPEEPFKSSL